MKTVSSRNAGAVLALAVAGSAANADTVESGISTEYETVNVLRVADGLENPWSVAFLPDGDYLVTERPGRLNRVTREGEITEIAGLPDVHVDNQGGLLDVALHPDYDGNGWVYFTYSLGDESGTTAALARGRLQGDALEDVETLFEQDRRSEPGRHYGSRLVWLDDGTLLMTIGDRGVEPERAQDPADHAGTVVRLTDDGGVPDDNPFVGDDSVLPEIYSWGHRNIQGMIVHPETGDIWATEHGPRGGDELNRIEAGGNYGWPAVTRGRDYGTQDQFDGSERVHDDDMIEPVYEFLPTLAPSGLALMTGDMFSAWQGDLMAGGLRAERVRRVVLEDNAVVHEEELFYGTVGRIRDVREGPDGALYLLSEEDEGGLYRVESAD
ncbi:PQQ-dependent sugar dehydrogenase [Aquisalimonas sp.]|uniref:PQQ-dependent sugar dehydrogenase n=1 Tax=Aquisalimonas sp. TaxID=1872621 RepID=UPI0025C0311A|nr:PQQ-dependent sugar dehydrogenase [Aquisalimonas sp.]